MVWNTLKRTATLQHCNTATVSMFGATYALTKNRL